MSNVCGYEIIKTEATVFLHLAGVGPLSSHDSSVSGLSVSALSVPGVPGVPVRGVSDCVVVLQGRAEGGPAGSGPDWIQLPLPGSWVRLVQSLLKDAARDFLLRFSICIVK